MKRTRRRRQVHTVHRGVLNARGRKRQHHNRYRYRVFGLRQSECGVDSRDGVFSTLTLTISIPQQSPAFTVYRSREGLDAI